MRHRGPLFRGSCFRHQRHRLRPTVWTMLYPQPLPSSAPPFSNIKRTAPDVLRKTAAGLLAPLLVLLVVRRRLAAAPALMAAMAAATGDFVGEPLPPSTPAACVYIGQQQDQMVGNCLRMCLSWASANL